ncbi:DarT1-associated NADAR antitoxin family protein [Deinococcus cellulosilyticus]|uniref:Uncharacterized protein n=1 Tax=Deinococcus cellulosilyticus (strain DSM 18568 / NBRC 106333 / KACC 11606 / 5516J-15) TaxID=1223518 RepID=A0A511N528_DEIC1|nr:hypothetical protein [Deinococcus cellulosilyticus]GEM47531.1 hypothetical protein DC3_31660 [Deinococcus cellulosilyticus NBRC 106333 = KACC 11606]
MAKRPVFAPDKKPPFVRELEVEFKWHPGLSRSQAQKSIAELHHSANQHGLENLLEISSKSSTPLGNNLSAFHLMLKDQAGQQMSVECAYQGSKVFEQGGPYTDLYQTSSREARQDERLRTSGRIIAFEFQGTRWPATPTTAFYDWLYLDALKQHPELQQQLLDFDGFTDIAFNPEKSAACQARCAAMFVALVRLGQFDETLRSQEAFLKRMQNQPEV